MDQETLRQLLLSYPGQAARCGVKSVHLDIKTIDERQIKGHILTDAE